MKDSALSIFSLSALLGVALILSSCGLLSEGAGGSAPPEPQSFSFDGVKLIRPDISDGSDQRTMQQNSYSVSGSSRVLLRFEAFLSKTNTISMANGRKVTVSITTDGSIDPATVQTALLLCPVLTNWMMLATWYKAYPMGNSGTWRSAGGDYDSVGCIAANAHTTNTFQFDVTPWVVSEVIGRNQNLGLILVTHSSSVINILGDQDPSNSPRIGWLKAQ